MRQRLRGTLHATRARHRHAVGRLGRRTLVRLAAALALASTLALGATGARAGSAPPLSALQLATDDAPAGGASASSEEQAAAGSPRAAVAEFVELSHSGRYDEAAQSLELPAADVARGPLLAKRLMAALDRHGALDLNALSPLPAGSADSGLPAGVAELTELPGPGGLLTPVRLVRRESQGGRWVFSRATVGRIDGWYGELDERWMFEHLPEPLLRAGPRGLLYWQWLALLPLAFLAWLGGRALAWLTRRLLKPFVMRTAATWDNEALERLGGPLVLGWALAIAHALLPLLTLYPAAAVFLWHVERAGWILVVFWLALRSLDVARLVLAEHGWAQAHPMSHSLLPLAARVGKLLIAAIAVVTFLSELGYPVTSLLAGLGIGGVAVALAAQKTIENLFGAFSIGADQPFREGDQIRIDGVTGTVERIGLRSTRIRTAERSVVTIPNGKLADTRVESLAARDRLQLTCAIGLVYSTSAAELRAVLAGLERVLREQPKLWPEGLSVRFKELGDSSLNLEVSAWFATADWAEFQLIRQEVLLGFLAVVEEAGTAFAFPTRTVHLAQAREAPREPALFPRGNP